MLHFQVDEWELEEEGVTLWFETNNLSFIELLSVFILFI